MGSVGESIVSGGDGFMKAWKNESIWCIQYRLNRDPCVSITGVHGKLQR